MKKSILALAAMISLGFGVNDKQIEDFFAKGLPEGVKFNIVSKSDVGGGFEQLVLEYSGNVDGKEVSQQEIIFVNGDFFTPELVSFKDGMSLKEKATKGMVNSKLIPLLKAEDPAYIINIGNDPKKPTEYMFSDPECPYCRAELARIEQELKDKNIKLIITPVHDRSALEKAALIYKETAGAKTDSAKVKILRKYYDPAVKYDAKSVSDAEVESMDKLRQKYFSSGLRAVPYKLDAN